MSQPITDPSRCQVAPLGVARTRVRKGRLKEKGTNIVFDEATLLASKGWIDSCGIVRTYSKPFSLTDIKLSLWSLLNG